jgi:hypothetical protein
MKLLLENWKRYQGEHDFNVLCENHTRGLITDTELVMLWENQVNNELDLLISEGIMDTLAIGYEKGKQLVGKAKETYDAAIEKLSDFFRNLVIQAWGLIQNIKEGLGRVAEVLKKALNTVSKFCSAHPILCKVVKLLLMMMAIAAVIALFSSSAEAAVQVTGSKGQAMTLGDAGVNAVKGVLEIGSRGTEPDIQQAHVEALRWLEKAHASQNMIELSKATGEGAQLCNDAFSVVKEYADAGRSIRGFVDIGEQVVIKTHSFSREVYETGKGLSQTHIEFQSLAVPPPPVAPE